MDSLIFDYSEDEKWYCIQYALSDPRIEDHHADSGGVIEAAPGS
jgi:hypothetical protein